ncbi:MAG: glycosyltransferase [Bacteroidota bacterium]
MHKKKVILTFIGYYLPGYKSGGPVRTISNMLDLLGKDYNFKIITRDRDSLDSKPYEGININQWNDAEKCKIYYLSKHKSFLFTRNQAQSTKNKLTNSQALRTVINNTEFDQYYLNSLFDFNFSVKVVLLWKLKLIPQKPILLAPRGELMEGALSIKPFKKVLFLTFTKVLRLYKTITWHASSKYEEAEIKREFGNVTKVKIAMDIPDFNLPKVERTHKKEKGKLKILFISSITPKKNLLFVIDTLNKVEGDFTLDIYGPVKDEKYWRKCLNSISDRIKDRITYKGVIPNDKIHTVYPNYDLFFFPTLGENFGHVIYESLYYGTPVLCSDQTPWDKLEEFGAGWHFKLDQQKSFVDKIEKLIGDDIKEFNDFIKGCFDYISFIKSNNLLSNNINIFYNFFETSE